jgi:uncharacterized membrane protein
LGFIDENHYHLSQGKLITACICQHDAWMNSGANMIIAARTLSQISLHMGVAFGVMYVFTGSFALGGVAAVLEPICNVILLPLHDRIWEKIGRRIKAKKGADTDVACTESLNLCA